MFCRERGWKEEEEAVDALEGVCNMAADCRRREEMGYALVARRRGRGGREVHAGEAGDESGGRRVQAKTCRGRVAVCGKSARMKNGREKK